MMKYSVAAGRFNYDSQTKKVKLTKQKGMIMVYNNQADQTHFSWSNTDTKLQQIDLIVFPNDAVFEPIKDKNNTFLLKFTTDDSRYFFWLQEKKDPEEVVKHINQIINYEGQQLQVELPSMQVERTNPSQKPNIPINEDFIKRMQQSIAKANQKYKNFINNLDKVIGTQAINYILQQTTPEEKQILVEYLPEEQKSVEFLNQNLKSPQFLQAIDTLSDALNSDNVLPLFMELKLNQKYLQQYYGIYAFLKAMDQQTLKDNTKMEEENNNQPKQSTKKTEQNQ